MVVSGTWTYSGDPRDSNKDAVRFLIGDTDVADQQISDEEVSFLLSENGGVYTAASAAARTIAAKFGRLADLSVGDLSISYSQRQQNYTDIAKTLSGDQTKSGALQVYSGGISRSDKKTQEQDTDWDEGFKRGQMDFPGTRYDRTLYSSTST